MIGSRIRPLCLTALLLFCVGATFSTLTKTSGWDFHVYYHAAEQAFTGRLMQLYSHYNPPNPWLYSPGLAIWLIPLAFVSRNVSFVLWTLAQSLVIVGLAWAWSKKVESRYKNWGFMALFAPLLLARPIVYIFLHGTIDFILFAVCLTALWSRIDPTPRRSRTIIAWAVFALLAIGKPMVLPLMAVPWVARFGVEGRVRRWEQLGLVFGGIASILPVFLVQGFEGGFQIHREWIQMLVVRGMPIDTQNQSVAAFLYRWLTDSAVGALSMNVGPFRFGFGWLSYSSVSRLVFIWTGVSLAAGLAWQWYGRKVTDSLTWVAILLAWVVLPSHFAWKAYFVFGLPLMGLALTCAFHDWIKGSRKIAGFMILGALLMNFSTADFIGGRAQAYIEAMSVFLWVHLIMIALVLKKFSTWAGAREQ